MIIERNFSKFVVFVEDTLLNALGKIGENKSGIIFAVSELGVLEGVLTDGDIRRWMIDSESIDLQMAVGEILNHDFLVASIDGDIAKIQKHLNHHIKAIPLVDASKRLVAVGLPGGSRLQIGNTLISEDTPLFIIAEIGNNHNGSLKLAKTLIDEAVKAGADCVKFQMRSMIDLYKNGGEGNDASEDLGSQYTLDLLRRFQLSDEEMYDAFNYCQDKGIVPLCTPWDAVSLQKLEQYGMSAYKLASADFTNHELIAAIAKTGKPLICSTGMSTEQEVKQSIKLLQQYGVPFALLHCNSTYPVPFKDINLRYMEHLKQLGNCLIGYSGHERDINIAIASVSLGAKIIEKHFTLDRSMEGNDHRVSLLPAEFNSMVKGIRQVEEAMGSADIRQMSQGEVMNREVLAKSLMADRDIGSNTIVTNEMIAIRSPGHGLQPNRIGDLVGIKLKQPKKRGDCFFLSDLEEAEPEKARDYKFGHRWGVPVRYHDMQDILQLSNMDLLEVHLSYRDMEIDFRDYIDEPLNKSLVVHAPELFAGDHTLDLCSPDDRYRKHSVSQLQRVIDMSRELGGYFNNKGRIGIVTNVGGFTSNRHIDIEERADMYNALEKSLKELSTEGVELLPQSMPPFPWHFGGQQYHNLFMDGDDIVKFCSRHNMRICLDISHSKLACNHFGWSFLEFVRKVSPYVAHMHLADARGVDGEGLQIGDGEIDWDGFWRIANEYCKDATFIPEIWQGHKKGNEGAWIALRILEKNYAMSLTDQSAISD